MCYRKAGKNYQPGSIFLYCRILKIQSITAKGNEMLETRKNILLVRTQKLERIEEVGGYC
jgi:hypothetical protein